MGMGTKEIKSTPLKEGLCQVRGEEKDSIS